MVKIQCQGCRIEFNISDDKIPENKPLKILCPKCKSPLEIHGKKVSEGADPETICLPDKNWTDPLMDFANAIDVVDEGVKTALLCDTDVKRAERIVQSLQELDFWVIHALVPRSPWGNCATTTTI